MKNAFAVIAVLLLAGCAASRHPAPSGPMLGSTSSADRPSPEFEALGDSGAAQARLYAEPLPLLGGRLEIRIIGVGQGTRLIVPTENEVALEVRTGNAIVTTNGVREEHAAGDIWVVPLHARVEIEASAETTVLRAMYFVKE